MAFIITHTAVGNDFDVHQDSAGRDSSFSAQGMGSPSDDKSYLRAVPEDIIGRRRAGEISFINDLIQQRLVRLPDAAVQYGHR